MMCWDPALLSDSQQGFLQTGVPLCVTAGAICCGVAEGCSCVVHPPHPVSPAVIPGQDIIVLVLFGFAGRNHKIISRSWFLHLQ